MSVTETFIVVISLIAAAGGSLVLLSCLAGMRAQLVKAFNMQKEIEAQRKEAERRAALEQEEQQRKAMLANNGYLAAQTQPS
jgi:hypothetical protein